MRINTSIPGVTINERDQNPGSARANVAYNFQGLRLQEPGDLRLPECGGSRPCGSPDVARQAFGTHATKEYAEYEEILWKRMKLLKGREADQAQLSARRDRDTRETPQVTGRGANKFAIFMGPERTVDPALADRARAVVLSNGVDPAMFVGRCATKIRSSGSSTSESSRRSHSSRAQKHLSISSQTPSTASSAQEISSLDLNDTDDDMDSKFLKSPLDQAAITLQYEEITGHNPVDPDDDGEGINGIGFKPTPAKAHARMLKRRQQLAEYKTREAKEARESRRERRRDSTMSRASRESREEQETARRVRFLQTEDENNLSCR